MITNFLGKNLWNKRANTSRFLLAVSCGYLGTGLSAEHLTVNLGNLDTLELGHISAFLLGEASTLPVRSLRAFGPWNSLALFLLHGLTLPLVDLVALLLGHVPALLGGNIAALLLVVNLLADLLSHWVTFFSVNSFAFATWLIPAFLFRNL